MAGFESLAYAVRLPVVARYLSELLLGVAAMIAVAGLCALVFRDFDFAGRAAAMTVLALAAGLAGRRLPTPRDLQVNEALVIIALAFVAGAGLMVWPLMAGGLGPWDAILESVSALTTTGLSTVAEPQQQTPAFLFARAWMQWYGGLVIVVLALGLVIEPGPAAKRLLGQESETGDLVGSTRARVRVALKVYTALLGFGVGLLVLLGVSPFQALLHSLSAVSTGGFSAHSASIAGLGGPAVQVAVILLCLCGAVSLSLYPKGWRGDWKRLAGDPDLRALLAAAGLVTVVLYLTLVFVDGRDWADSLRVAPLLGFSAQTTAGFEAAPVAALGPASKLTLVLAMFVGGDAGSTAGGIKIVRLLLLLRLVQHLLQRACVPRQAVLNFDTQDRRLPTGEVMAMLAVVVLFVLATLASWLVFLCYGLAPVDSLFEVVSAIGTVGLTTGLTDSGLPDLLKAVLCFDMLMGRLEVAAVVLLFYPRTWFGRRTEIA